MNVQLSQSIQWNDVGAGAYYQVLVNNAGGTLIGVYDAGQSTSAVLANIVDGLTLPADKILNLHVQSGVGPTMDLASGWSSPATQVTVIGYPVPNPPTVV